MLFFLPEAFWKGLWRIVSRSEQANVKIYYDQDCGFCFRTVRLIKTFMFLRTVEAAGAQSVAEIEAAMRQHNSWVVIDRRGTRHFGYDAGVVVGGVSPVFWIFTAIMNLGFFRRLGERVYNYVATHRRGNCYLPAVSSGNPSCVDGNHETPEVKRKR